LVSIIGVDFGVDSVKVSDISFNNSNIKKITSKQISPHLFDINNFLLKRTKYVANTGIEIEFSNKRYLVGYFHSLTSCAYGAHFLSNSVKTVLNLGARYTSIALVNEEGKITDQLISSPCNSANGIFLRNVCSSLGISLLKAQSLYKAPKSGYKISTVCPVMAETDIINLACKGLDISELIGVTFQMVVNRVVTLLKRIKANSPLMITCGISRMKIIADLIEKESGLEVIRHKNSFYAASIGAALLGAHRLGIKKLARYK